MLTTSPAVRVADAAPRAAPRRRASCLPDSPLGGAGSARAASGVLKWSAWHPGLENIVRETPGQVPVATAEQRGAAQRSQAGEGGRRGSLAAPANRAQPPP